MRTGLNMTLWAAIGIITFHEITKMQRVPRPEFYKYIAIIWATLGVVAEFGAYDIALAMAIGILISMLYTYVTKKAPPLTGAGQGKQGPVTRVPERSS